MNGALAQLGERLHGMQEVSGSIPLGSTIHLIIFAFRRTLANEVSFAGVFRLMVLASASVGEVSPTGGFGVWSGFDVR